MKRSIIVFCFMAYGLFPIIAQKAETAEARQYLEVLKKRSEKILDQYVEIPVGEQREKVRDLMVRQYWDLNKVHDTKNTKIEGLKKSGLPAGKFEKKKNGVEKKAEKKLLKLQKRYIKNLSKYLNEEQIDGIKEGMTLGAMAHNYRGFTEMIPTLTSEEKEYIRQQLLDARNKAMNMGSSEEKQAIFRQYKGKINNYLSEEKGYDLKKEGELWQERIKKAKK
ncbi:DUF3826 domain-containing protein [Proteiniphilum sp. UBA1028]|jgi:hypothetical protein|uniref:DUF3826 domain-containing protein n=1 Tax=Proteiniphilum sp. UBA1028 TaxID=1947251 RepID=UPI000E9E16F9|nr:DUF3826 domain-containing protein [Proteiniphilum sp. UBA1028]HBG59106.1 hypothetical protein [Porphyromonadaceae bacterium]